MPLDFFHPYFSLLCPRPDLPPRTIPDAVFIPFVSRPRTPAATFERGETTRVRIPTGFCFYLDAVWQGTARALTFGKSVETISIGYHLASDFMWLQPIFNLQRARFRSQRHTVVSKHPLLINFCTTKPEPR